MTRGKKQRTNPEPSARPSKQNNNRNSEEECLISFHGDSPGGGREVERERQGVESVEVFVQEGHAGVACAAHTHAQHCQSQTTQHCLRTRNTVSEHATLSQNTLSQNTQHCLRPHNTVSEHATLSQNTLSQKRSQKVQRFSGNTCCRDSNKRCERGRVGWEKRCWDVAQTS
eukprot:2942480-Rhodomonas_salina.3